MVDGIVGNLLSYDINFADGNTPNLFKRHWTERLNSVSAVYNYPADPVFVEFGDIQGEIKRNGDTAKTGRLTRKSVFAKASKLAVFDEDPESKDAEKSAVLFISCQNDFLEPEGKLYNKVKDVMSSLGTKDHLSELMDAAIDNQALVIHAPVAFEDSYEKAGFDEWGLSNMKGMFKPGSWGAELYKDTACSSDDVVLSGRKSDDCVTGSDLLKSLQDNQIERLFIAGLLTDGTVEKTVEQLSKKLKGKVTLHPVSDATATFSMDAQAATFKLALAKRSKPVTTDEAVSMLGGK
jgi:nicotinamidase-related amidase